MSETSTPATLNPADKPLDKMTVKELRELASTQFPDLKGISSMNKAPLIAAIQEAMGSTGAPAQPAAAPAAKPAAKAAPKAAKAPAPKVAVQLPAFDAEESPATTLAGKTKAEIKFLRNVRTEATDKATRSAARKQMKKLKKRTRRMAEAGPIDLPADAAAEAPAGE